MRAVLIVAAVLAVLVIAVSVGVGITELNYANAHPDAYGPAKVIAWGAGGVALLGVAVFLVALGLLLRGADRVGFRAANLKSAGGFVLRAMAALAALAVFAVVAALLLGGAIYRKDCLTRDYKKMTTDWTLQVIPYVDPPSDVQCISHNGTQAALDALGWVTFRKPEPEDIARRQHGPWRYVAFVKIDLTAFQLEGNRASRQPDAQTRASEWALNIDDTVAQIKPLRPPPQFVQLHGQLLGLLRGGKADPQGLRAQLFKWIDAFEATVRTLPPEKV